MKRQSFSCMTRRQFLALTGMGLALPVFISDRVSGTGAPSDRTHGPPQRCCPIRRSRQPSARALAARPGLHGRLHLLGHGHSSRGPQVSDSGPTTRPSQVSEETYRRGVSRSHWVRGRLFGSGRAATSNGRVSFRPGVDRVLALRRSGLSVVGVSVDGGSSRGQ